MAETFDLGPFWNHFPQPLQLDLGGRYRWGVRMNLQQEIEAERVALAVACCTGLSTQQADLLVRARDTIARLPCAAPEALLADFPSRDQFARLLEAEAFESAAIRMLGSKLGYMASRSPEGFHLVTVIAPGIDELVISADTLALALAAGLLTTIGVHTNGSGTAHDPGVPVRLN